MKVPKILNKNKQNQFKKIENTGDVIEDNPMKDMVDESNEGMEDLVQEIEANNPETINNKPKEVIEIVKDLPVQTVRRAKAEDGTIVTYMTIEEALTKIMNDQ